MLEWKGIIIKASGHFMLFINHMLWLIHVLNAIFNRQQSKLWVVCPCLIWHLYTDIHQQVWCRLELQLHLEGGSCSCAASTSKLVNWLSVTQCLSVNQCGNSRPSEVLVFSCTLLLSLWLIFHCVSILNFSMGQLPGPVPSYSFPLWKNSWIITFGLAAFVFHLTFFTSFSKLSAV